MERMVVKDFTIQKNDPFEFKLSHFSKVETQLKKEKFKLTSICLIAFIILFMGASIIGQFNILELVRLPDIFNYIKKTIPSIRAEHMGYDVLTWYHKGGIWLGGMLDSILVAYLATLLSTVAAFFLSFPASRNLMKNSVIYFIVRRYLDFCRGVPELVWALIFLVAYNIGPLPGIMAIFMHSTGSLGKLFSEVNENINMEDIEGIRSTGGNWFQCIRYGVVPQVLPNFTSYTLLRLEINIRASTILGFVGAGGIGHELLLAIRQFHYTDVSAICLIIILVVMILDYFCEKIRSKILQKETVI